MIPIRLEIEGLYSYRERQVIEFETLTAAGLFGIFGSVGSGKSAILEGILIALYGNPERVSNSGERSSMINLQHQQVDLKFVFRSGQNNGSTYLARYSVKRNKKDPEKIETASHGFYEQVGQEWQATPSKAEELIGMSRENFKQTIIIPQGKFRDFIDQKPTERAQMMQDLFGLDRFDLSPQTGSLLKQAREEKIRIEALINSMDGISSEILLAKQEEYAGLSQEMLQATQALQAMTEEVCKMEGTRKSFLELQNLMLVETSLVAMQPEMDGKRQLYRDFQSAKTYLRPIWDRILDLEKDLEKYQVSLIECNRFKESFAEEIKTLLADEVKFREINALRPQREGKIRDLKKVLEIQELASKQAQVQNNLNALLPAIELQNKEIQSLEQEVDLLEGKQFGLPNLDPSVLAELKTASNQLLELMQRKLELELALQEGATFLTSSKNRLTAFTSLVPEKASQSLEEWLALQKTVVSQLEISREKLLRTQGLTSHAHLLENGKPCPLCGASEHPNPLQVSASAAALEQAEVDLKQGNLELDTIRELIQKKSIEEIQYSNLQKNQDLKEQEKLGLEKQEFALWEKLKGSGIATKEELEHKISELAEVFQTTQQLQNQLNDLRKKSAGLRNAKEAAAQTLQQAQLQNQDLLSRIAGKQQEIKDPEFCEPYEKKEAEAIGNAIALVEKSIEAAAESLVGVQKHLQERQIAQSKNLADLQNFEALLTITQNRLAGSQVEFAQMMEKRGFTEKNALIQLFQQDLDAEKMDAEIRAYEQQVAATKARIKVLKAEEGIEEYSEDRFQTLQEEVASAKEKEKNLQSQVTLLNQELIAISQKLKEKQSLLGEFERIENRETNLRELDRLFAGKGFVRYVSSIYLRELCNTANKRFRMLTKNSLSLEIDDSNTFWVMDYLNGGKKRLLKTLSGGQTFQASLCLALALAEKVKALNQADQSFFFLDEGFGALDKNSLRVVFETLKALRHENRVVGIISHVEELQQEVGVYAQIELDPELGSQITYSY
jgi:exonuclease SbcC